MTDCSCPDFEQFSAELALGVIEAEDRVAAIGHAERCPDCRRDVRQLSDVVDGLAALIPAAEPPAGFESRVLAGLTAGNGVVAVRPRRVRPSPFRWSRWAVSAAAALALAVGTGGWLVGRSGSTGPGVTVGADEVAADLMAGSHRVGDVVVDHGPAPWITVQVTMAAPPGSGSVQCVITTADGRTVLAGTFEMHTGRNFWVAPVRDADKNVTQAELMSPSGAVLAVAHTGTGKD